MAAYAAVVLSAGSGSRMKSDIPKQYMDLLGKPVICYSLQAFEDSNVSEIVLVTGKNDMDYCRHEIVEKYGFTKVTAIVPGGAERYDSVLEGLRAVKNADYVMIHDGARPLLTADIISRLENAVEECGACVPGMPVKDTIKRADEEGYAAETPDRKYLWQIQTPQTFSYPLILSSYEKILSELRSGKKLPAITDDACVVELAADVRVKLVEGSYENIKITTPEDLAIAALHLKSRMN